jgi:O-succinylbenzoic acid--CoA ligase
VVNLNYGPEDYLGLTVGLLATLSLGGVARILSECPTDGLTLHGPLVRAGIDNSLHHADVVASRFVGGLASGWPVWADANAPAATLESSGSTGTPSRVTITTGQLTAGLRYRPAASPVSVIAAMPTHTIAGLHGVLLASLASGFRLIVPASSQPSALVAALPPTPSALYTTPSIAVNLAAYASVKALSLPSLRLLVLAGAPTPPSFFERLRAAFPLAGVRSQYGTTEAAGMFLSTRVTGTTNGLLGRASHGVVDVLSVEGKQCAPGVVGEISLRSSDSAPAISTGDLGVLDDTNQLWLVGRKKDIIISGGRKFGLQAVQATIAGLPGVVDCSVVGVDHSMAGEVAACAVVVENAEVFNSLRAAAAAALPAHMVPRLWLQLDAIPMLPSGKADRVAVARRFGSDQDVVAPR